MSRFLLSLLILASIFSYTALAGSDPIKFGEVSPDELKMTTYAADTSAPAVVLCDFGYFDPGDFSFTRITRIKILKKTGYAWASKTFPPYHEAFVKGITFNLENGKVTETKLESGSIFTETISGYLKRLRIAMPNVKVGSVIDIKFTYKGIPDAWVFQQEIPVKHSELIMLNSPYYSLRKNLSGFEPLKLNEDGHWIAENMPAFKAEPYISSAENYMTRLDFDILEVHYKITYEAYTTSWEALCRHLQEQEYFGLALKNDGYMNRMAKEIESRAKSEKEKLRMAHDYIKHFKWNKYESLYASEPNIKWALDKKSGNSADINLALIQLLDKLGFEVSPVLLSTRDNGFLSPVYPSLTRLNYVIARVSMNDQVILIDATEADAPYDLLPERCLNHFGRRFNTKQSDPVELTTEKKEKERVYYNLSIDDELRLTGQMGFQRIDYAALDFRLRYKEFSGKDAYLESMLREYPGLRIRNSSIENLDSIYLPVKDQYEVVLNSALEEIDGGLYLYPMLLHRMKENPFKSDQRKYPIDFIHPIEKTYSVTISLPDNFEVSSFPETLQIGLPGNAAYFLYQVSVMGKVVLLNFKIAINQTVFPENEYQEIREFFNRVMSKQAEPIILKKI